MRTNDNYVWHKANGRGAHCSLSRLSLRCAIIAVTLTIQGLAHAAPETIPVTAAKFSRGAHMTAVEDSKRLQFVIDPETPVPFTQSAVKQSREPATLGPGADVPYFTVRFAMPIPPCYTRTDVAALTGMDAWVFRHNHSPGFEILPNGDALAVFFSTPADKAEADPSTSFVQARLRYGSEDWDMPELFFKTRGYNDQSGMLWNDNGKLWFFGGGRGISDVVPFRIATSTDNGATWTFAIPQLDKPAASYTPQPITSAFRGPDRSIYMAMDGDDAESFLWRSQDDGVRWQDMGGRTGGRHSVIIPLDDRGKLLSIGGKNSNVDGWSPQNVSTNWGATWSDRTPSPFPPLGTAQRPSLIRLASGHLLFVSDSYLHKLKIAPPEGWAHGDNCFVAISKDNGASWHVKTLPVQMPAHHRIAHPSLGYVTARQAPNGVIHLLTTVTLPCLHYEFNEAWIWSDAGDTGPETSGGRIEEFSERYPNGQLRSTWSARLCPNGRYLLHGAQVDYYEDGTREHQATYTDGRKAGEETFWTPDGKKVWTWRRDIKADRGVWTHFWPNGKKKVESSWNLRPEARDLKRQFFGYVADGPARHWDEQGNPTESHFFENGSLVRSDQVSHVEDPRPRLLVLTDIGDDPDDEQSLVRLLLYANEFEMEGFVTELWWKDTHSGRHGRMTSESQMKLLHDALDLYGQVLPNLDRHAKGYPRAEALHKLVKRGKVGIQMTLSAPKGDPLQWIGPGQNTEGSDWIIEVVDREDTRPVDICIWGGSADLAQTLLRVREERSPAMVDAFVRRIRVHAISDQDDTGPWIRKNFPNLLYILDHDPGGDKWESCYRGMFYGGDESLTSLAWIDEHVRRNHGPLGAFYPPKTNTNKNRHGALKEGDTPSWFYFYRNGLNTPAHPDYGGWGGRYLSNGWYWQDAADTVDGDTSGRASVYRWRPAFQNDFAARMDWCVKDFKDANHAPVVQVNGAPRRIVKPGETVTLAATATDPDGDKLTYKWWQYADADSAETHVRIERVNTPDRASFVVPDEPGRQIHIILEVTDDGAPPLVGYQRIVFEVRQDVLL